MGRSGLRAQVHGIIESKKRGTRPKVELSKLHIFVFSYSVYEMVRPLPPPRPVGMLEDGVDAPPMLPKTQASIFCVHLFSFHRQDTINHPNLHLVDPFRVKSPSRPVLLINRR